MLEQFYRTSILLGEDGVNRLKDNHVIVAGVGGVGGYAVEALARAGVGKITIIDNDIVDITNINRQLIALLSDVGKPKVELFKQRISEINPKCEVIAHQVFIDRENIAKFIDLSANYVIDCIDTVPSKLDLITYCKYKKLKIASSMGAGNRYDVTRIKIDDISKTQMCALAKLIRLSLKKRKINKGVKVVYSTEHGKDPLVRGKGLRPVNGTISYLPAMFGLNLAGIVLKHLIDK